jgi:hypothetical protein
MLSSFATSLTSQLPPVIPGVGGALITGFQVIATLTSFSAETNPQTTSQYSKFAPEESKATKMIASRDGMTLIYLPAFIVSSTLYCLAEVTDISFLPEHTLAGQFVIVHFLKRLLEVLFLHKYSGKVSQNLSLGIGFYYALSSALICSVALPAELGSTATTVGSGE